MKQLFLFSLLAFGAVGVASASPLAATCSVLMSPNEIGASSSLCTVTADPGDYLTSFVLTGTDDYTGFQDGNPMVSFTGTFSLSAAITTPFASPTFCDVVTAGDHSTSCSILPNPNTASNLDTSITSLSLQLTNASNTVTGGAVTGTSIVLHLNADEASIPGTSTAPEPATFALMGSSLIGIALLLRRTTS